MKLPHLLALVSLCWLLPACQHSSAPSTGPLPNFKITDYEIVSLPSTNLSLMVSGGGATPNSKVTVSLRYQTGREVKRQLGTVTADQSGSFKLARIVPCLPNSPSSPRFEAVDVFTGIVSRPASFDPELLKCNY